MLYAISLIIGIALLTLGGEALIRGAIAAARRFGVSPLLTGLVIVGFGTSSPELVVSVDAAINSQPDIAVGNIVGSNIGNILLILGLSALITPMTVQPLALRRDGLVVVLATFLFLLLSWGGALGRIDAILFLSGLAAYLLWAYWSESRQQAPAGEVYAEEDKEISTVPRNWLTIGAAIVIGLILLIGGSRLLLYGAIGIAQAVGVPETVIGLTLVAVGTSLPELAVSVIAAFRHHADVAVGNILGSNIFNVLGILGISALLQPLPIAARIQNFDQWVMLGAAVVLMLFLYTGLRLSRREGGILLASYTIYVWLSFTAF
ncbi:calcium/sodium antiporter [Halomonas shantousis]